MASIRKRTLPSGKSVWQVDYRDQRGKRRAKQFPTKREADAWLVGARAQVAAGTHTADTQSITVGEACDLWLQDRERLGRRDATLKQYREHAENYLKPRLGSVRLSRLTRPQVVEFRDTVIADKSTAMARKVLTSLRSVIAVAWDRGHIATNVAADVRVPARGAGAIRAIDLREIPTPADFGKILDAADQLDGSDSLLIRVLAFTGLRISEALGLAWDAVDLRKGVIHVRQAIDFNRRVGEPKSGASLRTVDIGPDLKRRLSEWRLAQPQAHRSQGLVFPGQKGQPQAANHLYARIWRPLMASAKLVDRKGRSRFDGFHTLRHFFASYLIDQGASVVDVSRLMGHSRPSVTSDVYAHVLSSKTRNRAWAKNIERIG